MLSITITEQTPHNMLRAIRAACNELLGESHADLTTQAAEHNSRAVELHAAAEAESDKAAAALAAPYGQGGLVDSSQFYRVGEQPSEQTVLAAAFDKAALSTETDSSGTEWNADLHASTKSKNGDGTWKKRRGAGQNVAEIVEKQEQQLGIAQTPSLLPLPPAPPAAPLVTMNDIYALVANGKALLNDVIAAAQAMGFADVGAFSRDATPEQRAQLLDQLTAGADA